MERYVVRNVLVIVFFFSKNRSLPVSLLIATFSQFLFLFTRSCFHSPVCVCLSVYIHHEVLPVLASPPLFVVAVVVVGGGEEAFISHESPLPSGSSSGEDEASTPALLREDDQRGPSSGTRTRTCANNETATTLLLPIITSGGWIYRFIVFYLLFTHSSHPSSSKTNERSVSVTPPVCFLPSPPPGLHEGEGNKTMITARRQLQSILQPRERFIQVLSCAEAQKFTHVGGVQTSCLREKKAIIGEGENEKVVKKNCERGGGGRFREC